MYSHEGININVKDAAQSIVAILRGPLASYVVYGGVAKGVPFLGVIVFANFLSPSEFAISAIFISIVALTSSLLGFGVNQLVVRSNQFLDQEKFSTLVSASHVLALIVLVSLLTIVGVFREAFVTFPVDFKWIGMAIVFAYFMFHLDVSAKILVVKNEASRFGRLEVCKVLLGTVLSVVAVVLLKEEALIGRVSGYCLGLAFSCFVARFFLRKHVGWVVPSLQRVYENFVYGLKVLPQIISNWIKVGADKLLLIPLFELSDLGVYGLTISICSSVMLFGNAVNNIFTAKSMEFYRNNRIEELKRLRGNLLFYCALLCVLSSMLLVGILPIFIPSSYIASAGVVYVLILSFYAQTVYLLFMKYFLFSEETSRLAWLNFVGSLLYLGLLLSSSEGLSLFYAACILAGYHIFVMLAVMLLTLRGESKLLKRDLSVSC